MSRGSGYCWPSCDYLAV